MSENYTRMDVERWQACGVHHFEGDLTPSTSECTSCGALLAWVIIGEPSYEEIMAMNASRPT